MLFCLQKNLEARPQREKHIPNHKDIGSRSGTNSVCGRLCYGHNSLGVWARLDVYGYCLIAAVQTLPVHHGLVELCIPTGRLLIKHQSHRVSDAI